MPRFAIAFRLALVKGHTAACHTDAGFLSGSGLTIPNCDMLLSLWGSNYESAMVTAVTMHNLMELEYLNGLRDLDAMLCWLKDLSTYSLTHEEILYQREGPELLALSMFFGLTNVQPLEVNQHRLQYISQAAYEYRGQAEVIEQQVAQRKTLEKQCQQAERQQQNREQKSQSPQMCLI